MKLFKTLGMLAVTAALIGFVAPANAQTGEKHNDKDKDKPRHGQMHGDKDKMHGEKDKHHDMRGAIPATTVEKIVGSDVWDNNGNKLGEVNEIIGDPMSGRLSFLIIDAEKGDVLRAVPWEKAQFKKEGHLIIAQDTFNKCAPFEDDAWPDFNDIEWSTNAYRGVGADPYWEGLSDIGDDQRILNTVRFSSLDGQSVENTNDEELGEIECVVVDTKKGNVLFAVLDTSAWYRVDERPYVPVPLSMLSLTGDGDDVDDVIMKTNKDEMKLAPRYAEENMSNFTDVEGVKKVYAHYNVKPYWETQGQQRTTSR